MRLIFGFVRLDGAPARKETLDAMVDALVSPGLQPISATSIHGPAALGLLDFSAAYNGCGMLGATKPPDMSGGLQVTADIRLDRPRELAAALGLPATASNDALALAAVSRWGQEVPDRVDGDFALAAWDSRRRRLICARDAMGVRPLCYTWQPGRLLAFSSLPRGLHAAGLADPRPDPLAMGRLIVDLCFRNGSTGFSNIKTLAAGHSLVLTPEGLRIHRAWRPQPSDVGRWRGSPDDAARTLRGLIEDAVDCRLPASGPVAAHLSGGLDSSAIAAIAARILNGRRGDLHAYSLLPSPSAGSLMDERPFVDDVLRRNAGIRWTPVHLSPLHREGIFEPDFPLAPVLDQPDQEICASARTAGIGIVLSGTGGDTCATYHGYGIQAELLRKHRWNAWWTQMNGNARHAGRSLVRTALSEFAAPLAPAWLGAWRRQRSGLSKPGDRQRHAVSFLQPSLAAQVMDSLPQAQPRSDPAGRIEMLDAGEVADRGWQWSIIGARHGIAYSYPLADRRILDFILSLPIERLVDRGYSRQPFRNAMEGILPESIRWRRTKFVPFPDLAANIMTAAPLVLPRVDAVRRCPAAREMFDIDAIRTCLSTAARITEAEAVTRTPEGQTVPRRPLRMAMHALRALVLAEYVGRMNPSE